MNWMMLKLAFERLSTLLSLFLLFPFSLSSFRPFNSFSSSFSLLYACIFWLTVASSRERGEWDSSFSSLSQHTHNGLCDVTSIRQRDRENVRWRKKKDAQSSGDVCADEWDDVSLLPRGFLLSLSLLCIEAHLLLFVGERGKSIPLFSSPFLLFYVHFLFFPSCVWQMVVTKCPKELTRQTVNLRYVKETSKNLNLKHLTINLSLRRFKTSTNDHKT